MNTNRDIVVRSLADTDLEPITALDEKISGTYRPEVWERRVGYYLRRDPEASAVAESDGILVGFMLGEIRSGEFGLDEPTGWIEVMGVDPERRGESIGRRMAEAMLERFRSQGVETVRTLVDEEMEEIQQFFAALGFVQAGPRPFVKKLQAVGSSGERQ